MLIVSDDSKTVVNLDNVFMFNIGEVFGNYKIYAIPCNIGIPIVIGTYETEVKARSVLNNLLYEYRNRIPDENTVYKMTR